MAYYLKLLGPNPLRVRIDHGDVIVIGRSQDADICLDDKLISRKHCELSVGERGIVVHDLDSRNGTALNGKRFRGERTARPGDQVKVGNHFILIEREREAGMGSSATRKRRGTSGRHSRSQPLSSRSAAKLPSLPGYELRRELGQANVGCVYEARSLLDGKTVAIKVTPKGASEQAIRRFLRSADALRRLDHPNIVNVHDIGQADGQHFYTMEFLEGRPLRKVIAQEPLGVREALSTIVQVARALRLTHERGVIHRDVSPENIFIQPGQLVKLLGFGFVKQLGGAEESLTSLGEVVGNISYSSPEQVKNPSAVDARADLYSLGAVLYHAIVGEPPFSGKNQLEVLRRVLQQPAPRLKDQVPDVPDSVNELVSRLLKKDPTGRFQTALEVEEALEGALLDVCGSDRTGEMATGSSFGGGFSGAELLEIVQFLELHKKDGRLVVSAPTIEGEIGFAQGVIISASAGLLVGEEATLQLIKQAEGTFRFRPLATGERIVDTGLALRPSVVAIEVLRERDERGQRDA